jgi:hypothetical protein
MILSDREIRAAQARGALTITPEKGYEGRFSIQGPTQAT